MKQHAISIDIGGTNTRVALVDDTLTICDRTQFLTNPSDPAETLQRISDVIRAYDCPITGVGMSCPGPLDLLTGSILTPPNLTGGWHHFAIAAELKKRCSLPVYLNNDANLAALAEATIGEGKNCRFVQFLTISTGVGSGFVIDKQIYMGAHGFANEVQNSIVMQDGPIQGNLAPGAIEALSSGTAITLRAQAAGLNVQHAGEVNTLAKAGNTEAQRILQEAKNYLANFIAFLYAYADPDIVILGGSVALKIEGFTEEVEALVKEKVLDVVRPFVNVRKSTLSEDSGLLGAACLAFSKS